MDRYGVIGSSTFCSSICTYGFTVLTAATANCTDTRSVVFVLFFSNVIYDFQKHTDEALDIINAFGDVTPEHLKRDYDRVFTIAVYCLFLRKFLNMLK